MIETDSYREDVPTPELRKQFEATIPVRKMGRPRDAARVAVFLAGPDSDYMTGMTFAVDGGSLRILEGDRRNPRGNDGGVPGKLEAFLKRHERL